MAPTVHSAEYGHETVEVISHGQHSPSPAFEQPMPDAMGNSETPAVDAAPGLASAVNPSENPAVTPEAAPDAPKPKADDYEKDPEPSSTELEKTEPSATRRLVAGYKRPAVNYVDQLVRNASHSADQEQVAGE